MNQIGVECRFAEDGAVRVFRIYRDQTWISVEQGRQWVDRMGRHVLIMLPDNGAVEICLRSDTMTWQVRPVENQTQHLA
jgi:hypothetical protein